MNKTFLRTWFYSSVKWEVNLDSVNHWIQRHGFQCHTTFLLDLYRLLKYIINKDSHRSFYFVKSVPLPGIITLHRTSAEVDMCIPVNPRREKKELWGMDSSVEQKIRVLRYFGAIAHNTATMMLRMRMTVNMYIPCVKISATPFKWIKWMDEMGW